MGIQYVFLSIVAFAGVLTAATILLSWAFEKRSRVTSPDGPAPTSNQALAEFPELESYLAQAVPEWSAEELTTARLALEENANTLIGRAIVQEVRRRFESTQKAGEAARSPARAG